MFRRLWIFAFVLGKLQTVINCSWLGTWDGPEAEEAGGF
jgi:hypothetical protein